MDKKVFGINYLLIFILTKNACFSIIIVLLTFLIFINTVKYFIIEKGKS